MARWKRKKTATFEDMPAELRELSLDAPPELKRRRADWLEKHHLALVDYFGWLREQNPAGKLRPPARRRLLSPQARAELDARLEREGKQW